MATSKTLAPTNVTISIPAMTDAPNASVLSNCIDKEADAINTLNSQIANKTYSMKSGTAAYGVLVRCANVVFFTVFNQSWNGVASTSIISNDSSAVTLAIPSGYKPAYNVEIKETLNDKRITIATNGDVSSNEAFSGLNLRFSGCWITNDSMPS